MSNSELDPYANRVIKAAAERKAGDWDQCTELLAEITELQDEGNSCELE